ncbi:MAG: DUF1492 domain-containing protein [Candidatus Coprovivens sp.]
MTKEELSKYYYLKQEIKQIEDKIEEIDSTFMRASLINCEKFERKLSNPQEKRMILIEKYEQKLEIAINKSIGELIKIEEFINSIEDPENRMIFRYRYIELKSWNEISSLIHISRSAIFERHNKILKT